MRWQPCTPERAIDRSGHMANKNLGKYRYDPFGELYADRF